MFFYFSVFLSEKKKICVVDSFNYYTKYEKLCSVATSLGNQNDEKEIREYKVADLKFKPRRRNDHVKMDAELHALEQMERKDAKK